MLADVLRQAVGTSGYSARAGGEEFIAYLPNASLKAAMTIGNLVRVSFEHGDWASLGIDRAFTVSCALQPFSKNLRVSTAPSVWLIMPSMLQSHPGGIKLSPANSFEPRRRRSQVPHSSVVRQPALSRGSKALPGIGFDDVLE